MPLIYIAQCESGGEQFTADGSVVRSKTNDYGLYQINSIHKKEALALGYDIMTPEGNTAFALYLYAREGTRPWNPSKHCWQPKLDELYTGSEGT